MIINWWNLLGADLNKIWDGTTVSEFIQEVDCPVRNPKWGWWNDFRGMAACKRFYEDLKFAAWAQ